MLGVKRARELSRLTVAHLPGDLADRGPRGEHLCGALHPHALDMSTKARLACLREGALQLAWGTCELTRNVVECEGPGVL